MRDDPPSSAEAVAVDGFARTEPPLWEVSLWPHRSLTRRGRARFVALLALGLSIPAISVWPSPILWVLLPFEALAVALLWGALWLSDRQGRVREILRLWPDLVTVERIEPDGHRRRWSANPFWVRVGLADTAQVPRYLTLSGGGRTIELGRFLTPAERETLAEALRAALVRAAQG